MSQLISPSIFDLIQHFPLQYFPEGPRTYQIAQLVNSGVYTSLKKKWLGLGFLNFNARELKIWIRKVRSDFIINDVTNVHCNTTTAPASVTPNQCITFY